VPLVIAPTDWDKPEIAQRVVASGAGLRLAGRDCTPAGVRRAVDRILGEPSFAAAAERLAGSFRRQDGPTEAARLLSALAETHVVRERVIA
jgi:UDP:flavonoid glycosyltransferase YjiC (YdhE family)